MENSKEKTVIVLTVSAWEEPKRLRKQMAELLAIDHDVVYVVLPYGLLKPKETSDAIRDGVRVINIGGPVVPLRLILSIPALRRMYLRRLSRRLDSHLAKCRSVDAVLSFTHNYPDLLHGFDKASKIYVANDNHAAIANHPKDRARIEREEASVISQCQSVITVSGEIAGGLRNYGRPIHLMYPGHDCTVQTVDSFSKVKRQEKSACFWGYIDWRIDFDLLSYLLSNGWSVTLIGPIIGREEETRRLAAQHPGRFFVHGPVGTNSASDRLAEYQVLIMPYRFHTEEQRAAIELPNKTFVYFSALRPIVTTWMPNLRLVEAGLIYMAAHNLDFAKLCDQAVEEDCLAYAKRRRDLALENTWDSRRRRLNGIIFNSGG